MTTETEDLTTLITALRADADEIEGCGGGNEAGRMRQAANALDALRTERDTLRTALQPFAKAADAFDPAEGDDNIEMWGKSLLIGDLRRARAALNPSGRAE